MEQIRLNYWEAILIATLIGVGIGILLGLIPLILGIRKGKKRLGVYGLISSTVGGALSGILSLIIVGIFIWLILKQPDTDSVRDASDSQQFDSKDADSEVINSKALDSSDSKSSDSDNS